MVPLERVPQLPDRVVQAGFISNRHAQHKLHPVNQGHYGSVVDPGVQLRVRSFQDFRSRIPQLIAPMLFGAYNRLSSELSAEFFAVAGNHGAGSLKLPPSRHRGPDGDTGQADQGHDDRRHQCYHRSVQIR